MHNHQEAHFGTRLELTGITAFGQCEIDEYGPDWVVIATFMRINPETYVREHIAQIAPSNPKLESFSMSVRKKMCVNLECDINFQMEITRL